MLLAPAGPGAAPPERLVTVTGLGGAGKTRLALEMVRYLSPKYDGALWFVPLADVSHPGQIGDAIIEALAIPRSTQAQPLEQLADFLQSYPAALLILDNFEHLQEEGTVFVRQLSQRLPGLSCLVTSRL